jgi:MYXO-CTERM domain-containing protein
MRFPIVMRASVFAISIAVVIGSASQADAFCGFYVGGAGAKMFNNATEVVLMRHGTTTVLSMQNNYQGPPEGFALVVPVPVVVREGQVKTLPREVFGKIDVLGAPRLVEYWEQDPCRVEPQFEFNGMEVAVQASSPEDDDEEPRPAREYHVKIEARFSVGEYNIVVLSATESTGLERWLRDHKYVIPADVEPLLRPYIEQGSKFFVAKVDPKKVTFENGMATLSPLRFYYDSPDFVLPIRLGLANSSGMQDLIVNILAPNNTRYEAANHPNVTIPTNLPVNDIVRTRFGEFYAALFDHTLEQVPNAVVTEYAWDSGSCDPCPGPTLDANDLATLGADVIGSTYKNVTTYGFTLTRLHARYGKEVKDDLSFRAVDAIVGGRGIPDPAGAMSTSVDHDASNNFQGRYVILHPWTGAVTCPSPNRGRWGGPPGQQLAVTPATNLAFAPRGKAELSSMVAKDVPSIGVLASKGAQLPIPIRQPQGCGCRAEGGGAASLGALAVLGFVLRRRRRS